MLGVMFPQSDSLHWVSSEWVRDRVEHGTLFGTQTIFSPALIERFFTMRESANRSERRRTVRARPDIPILTVPIPEVPSRRPSPPVVESSETSFQFRYLQSQLFIFSADVFFLGPVLSGQILKLLLKPVNKLAAVFQFRVTRSNVIDCVRSSIWQI